MADVVQRYVLTAAIVAAIFGVAALSARYVARNHPKLASPVVRCAAFLIGTGMLLVAGIGRLGWEIQTFDGQTAAECLDQTIFWILSVVGTGLLVYDFFASRSSR